MYLYFYLSMKSEYIFHHWLTQLIAQLPEQHFAVNKFLQINLKWPVLVSPLYYIARLVLFVHSFSQYPQSHFLAQFWVAAPWKLNPSLYPPPEGQRSVKAVLGPQSIA